MTEPTSLLAVPDTDVLYSAAKRDILLQSSRLGLVELKWTDDIRRELMNALSRNRPNIQPARLERIWTEMNRHFPNALVAGYEHLIPALRLPDPDDKHILAAAIQADCDLIVTQNLRDYPDAVLAQYGIVALSLDSLMMRRLVEKPEVVCQAVRLVRRRLRRPPYSPDEYLRNLEKHGLAVTAEELRQYARLLE